MAIIFGGTVGAMGTVIVILTSTLIIVTVALVRSKRTLRRELDLVQAQKTLKEPAIYEEIVLHSRKTSTPSIDTGENTAYMSVWTCQSLK